MFDTTNSNAGHRGFRFAGYQLDEASRTLRDANGALAIGGLAFDLLLNLSAHCDHIVSDEDVFRGVWGDDDTRVGAGVLG